jgi:hypothetical protein
VYLFSVEKVYIFDRNYLEGLSEPLNGILLETFTGLAEVVDLLRKLHLNGAGTGNTTTILKMINYLLKIVHKNQILKNT